jgi:hypothetical protein
VNGKSFTVSGVITVNGSPAKGVSVKSGSSESLTNEDGEYVVSAPAGSDLALVPYMAGYSFIPESASFENIKADKTGVNFSGFEVKLHSAEGLVVNDVLRGVKGVSIKGLKGVSSAVTSSKGFYKISGLKHNEKILIAPESDRYDFYPQSIEITAFEDVKNGDIFAYPKKIKKPQVFIYGGFNSEINASSVKEVVVVMVSGEDGKVTGQIIDEQDNAVYEFEDILSANAASAVKWNMVSSVSRKKVPSGEYCVILNGAGFKDETASFKIIR